MEVKDLRIRVAGKIALPVRAIPHVTGWRISPDLLAKAFARMCPSPFKWLENTSTFHLVDGSPASLTPKDWDGTCAAIAGLEGELRETNPNDDVGYAKWRNQSISLLPAGVLVWVSEFEADWKADTQRRHIEGVQVRDGEDLLNYTPPLPMDVMSQTFEGLELMTEFDTPEYTCAFSETIFNGKAIDWRYWVHDMATISRAEAARLMCGLDPDLFDNLASRPNKNDPTQLVERARKIERLAASEKFGEASPEDWLEWARSKRINMHEIFVIETQNRARAFQKRQTGRYTLEEAANCLAKNCEVNKASMVLKLIQAVHKGELPTYRPGYEERIVYGDSDGAIRVVRSFWEEVYWDDLNGWLKRHEKRLQFQFAEPEQSEKTSGTFSERPLRGTGGRGVSKKTILAHVWPFNAPLASSGNFAVTRKVSKGVFDQVSLRNALADSPKWIEPARVAEGNRGQDSARWNPALLAERILSRRYATQARLDSFMESEFPDWYDEWQRLTVSDLDKPEH